MSAAIMCVNQTAPAVDMDYVTGQREVGCERGDVTICLP